VVYCKLLASLLAWKHSAGQEFVSPICRNKPPRVMIQSHQKHCTVRKLPRRQSMSRLHLHEVSTTELSTVYCLNLVFLFDACTNDNAGLDSSVSIATRYELDGPGIESRWGEIFRTRPDQPWGPPTLPHNGYRVFPGGKAAGAWLCPPTPSSAEVK
jgi:hypothetical protein